VSCNSCFCLLCLSCGHVLTRYNPQRSCDPLCDMCIDEELTVRLVSRRAIPAGEPISIDYELLEEDMVVQGVDFDCSCGAALCRGRIVGARRRAAAAASPA
jgi:hypothetical protein